MLPSSLDMAQLPGPLKCFATQDLLKTTQLTTLLSLEEFFPAGLQDPHWSHDEPDASDLDIRVDALMNTWRDKRPEQEPPAPIWKCDRNLIATHPQLPHLLVSHNQLWETAITQALTVPQWIVTAWWWGCAAIVCNTSLEKFEVAISGWQQRYRCAVLYLQSPEMKRDHEIVAEYQADLSYSNSAHIPESIDLAWAAKDDFNWKHWQLPSALQPWGSRAQLGQKVMARPQT